MSIKAKTPQLTTIIRMRKKGNAFTGQRCVWRPQIVNLDMRLIFAQAIDDDRIMEYQVVQGAGMTIDMLIRGWWL